MGYTHYWKLNRHGNEKNYKKAVKDIKKIISHNLDLLAAGDGTGSPEYKHDIAINGQADLGEDHETFYLPEKLIQAEDFDFCKTAQKPYDVIVTACLSVLVEYLGQDVDVSSDGNAMDWESGVELASKILKRQIQNPIAQESKPMRIAR